MGWDWSSDPTFRHMQSSERSILSRLSIAADKPGILIRRGNAHDLCLRDIACVICSPRLRDPLGHHRTSRSMTHFRPPTCATIVADRRPRPTDKSEPLLAFLLSSYRACLRKCTEDDRAVFEARRRHQTKAAKAQRVPSRSAPGAVWPIRRCREWRLFRGLVACLSGVRRLPNQQRCRYGVSCEVAVEREGELDGRDESHASTLPREETPRGISRWICRRPEGRSCG
jgi:hypothetical protein